MELPRGCMYWNNSDAKFLIEGTVSTIHDFDGCCYGLRQKFGDSNLYIKKPWRIMSWNVDVGSRLSLRCDGRHEHAPCAGRETVHTQIYTSKIVSIILEEQNRRNENLRAEDIPIRNTGSSGCSMRKSCVAAACVVPTCEIEKTCSHTKIEREATLSEEHESTVIFKNNLRSGCLWALPLILKCRKPNPKKGSRVARAGRWDPAGTSPAPQPWQRVVLVPGHTNHLLRIAIKGRTGCSTSSHCLR